MIKFDEVWSMDLIGIFPCVVAFRVTFPLDQILQGLALPPGPMGTYLYHFVFRFPINQIQWQLGEVRAVCWCFSVGHQKTSVEHWMDIPLGRKFESDRYW
jgi:hypothetical protein